MATRVTFDNIVRYFRAENLEFAIGKDDTVLLTVAGKHVPLTVQVSFIHEKEIIALHAVYPFRTPPDRIAEVLELAARINWGLLFATAEVNPENGAIRFRSTMLVDDTGFNREQFATLFATGCSTADRYAPAFQKVIEGRSIKRSLAAVEGAP